MSERREARSYGITEGRTFASLDESSSISTLPSYWQIHTPYADKNEDMSERTPSISAFFPTYNELENIPVIVDRMRSVLAGQAED